MSGAVESGMGQLFADVLAAREAADEGRYCQCETPEVGGLMCHRCKLRHEAAVMAATERISGPHAFVPGLLQGALCKVCTCEPSDARHIRADLAEP